jgi:hypothetical protein
MNNELVCKKGSVVLAKGVSQNESGEKNSKRNPTTVSGFTLAN